MSVIEQQLPRLIELRHRLHRIPELAYEEVKTAGMIREELDRLEIEYVAGAEGVATATVAWIGDVSKPCIALRADIDALPIVEQTGLAYASTHPGRMHACGHDGHSAILAGVAGMLKTMQAELPVCVKLIWQPAEEGGGGAARLIKAGVLDGRIGPRVDAIFGLHGWPCLKVGHIASKAGPLMAGMDNFAAVFRGRGCHGGFPYLGRDPIVTACEAVLNLQQIVSRESDPTDSVVVTIGTINAGTAVNIIPDEAKITGTVRTHHDATRQQVRIALQRRLSGVAAANECQLRFDWFDGYPPLHNDPTMTEYVAQTARGALGADGYVPVARPSMGAEDFAYFLEKVPGCFFFLGVEPVDRNGYPSLHSDRYDFTDAAIAVGMKMFIELAMRFRL